MMPNSNFSDADKQNRILERDAQIQRMMRQTEFKLRAGLVEDTGTIKRYRGDGERRIVTRTREWWIMRALLLQHVPDGCLL